LAEGTEVLTTNGWKDLGDVTTEDNCLVYDLQTGEVFFEYPKRVVEYDFDGEMIQYSSKNKKQFSQLVTPNHRMPIIHRDIKKDGTRTKYFKEAQYQNYAPHHLAPISGRLCGNNEKSLSPVEKFFIAAQADGTVYDRYTGERCGTVPVFFNLTKQRKIDRLISISNECGFEIIELADDKRDNSKRFKVNVPLEEMPSNIKTFDWVDFSSVNYAWSLEFLEELSEWDSHKINETSFTYSTTMKVNSDVVQAIASLCNKSPRLVIHSDDRKDSYKDVYSINIIDRSYKDGQSINKEYVPYKGKVRCLETSTGAFLIRFNGVVSVTGNTIHSRSYTHLIRNVYPDPSKVFDEINSIKEIVDCAEDISVHYDNLINYNQKVAQKGYGKKLNKYEHKRRLWMALVAVNILEGIRFYVSFACSWAFAEQKKMEGNAKIIKFICRDENIHLGSTQFMLTELPKEDPDFKKIRQESEDEMIQMYIDAVEQEKAWAHYLFKNGSMIGLNENLLGEYVEWICCKRMNSIDLKCPYTVQQANPLPWTEGWITGRQRQVAPQEVEKSEYIVGEIDKNVDETFLGGLSL
jgi:ribonucleotide reductase beta subunit family protein with ferritin-like domain